MKKLILLMMLPFIMKGQKDSLFIVREKDDMTDKVYYFPSKKMILFNKETKTGIALTPFIEKDFTFKDLNCKIVNVGNCNEKDELILMFQDSSKIKLTSFADFNCKGSAFFNLKKVEIEKLRTLKIIKAKITNGRTYESYTSNVDEKDQSYFIDLAKIMDTKTFKDKASVKNN